MGQSKMEKLLDKMQENWDKNKDAGFASVPPGTYTAKVQNMEVTQAQSSGNMQMHTEFLVLEGEHEDTVVHDYIPLETEWGPGKMARVLTILGYEVPDKAKKLLKTAEGITEKAPSIQFRAVERKDGVGVNINVMKLLGEDYEPESSGEGSSGDEAGDFSVGDRVIYTDGDDKYPGEVTELNVGDDDDLIQVHFDDGDDGAINPKDLEKEAGASDGDGSLSVGDRVIYTDGKKTFPGEVMELGTGDEGDLIAVHFDDGDDGNIDPGDLEPEGEGAGDKDKPSSELLAFCQAQDISVDDDDSEQDVIDKIKENRWDKAHLTKKEVKLLESIDAEFVEPKKASEGKGSKGSGKAGKGSGKGSGKGGKTGKAGKGKKT